MQNIRELSIQLKKAFLKAPSKLKERLIQIKVSNIKERRLLFELLSLSTTNVLENQLRHPVIQQIRIKQCAIFAPYLYKI